MHLKKLSNNLPFLEQLVIKRDIIWTILTKCTIFPNIIGLISIPDITTLWNNREKVAWSWDKVKWSSRFRIYWNRRYTRTYRKQHPGSSLFPVPCPSQHLWHLGSLECMFLLTLLYFSQNCWCTCSELQTQENWPICLFPIIHLLNVPKSEN